MGIENRNQMRMKRFTILRFLSTFVKSIEANYLTIQTESSWLSCVDLFYHS